MKRLIALAAGALVLTVVPLSGVASAAATCSFDGVSHIMTVDMGATSPSTALLARTNATTSSPITVNGTQCGTATVSTVDTINVTSSTTNLASSTVTLNLANGGFVPGFTSESADPSTSEIEFNITLSGTGSHQVIVAGATGATAVNDSMRLGANKINLNAAAENVPDADVTILNLGTNNLGTNVVDLQGGDGDDSLSSQGGLGVPGSGVTVPYAIEGGNGNDKILEGALDVGGSIYSGIGVHGNAGNDKLQVGTNTPGSYTMFGDAGNDQLRAGTVPATMDGGDDKDLMIGSSGADTMTGGNGNDNLQGRDGNDSLLGQADNDSIQPGLGVDTADGGAGTDIVGYQTEGGGVNVNLATGTKTGPDSDSLANFESITGGQGGDTLTGDANNNKIIGSGGNDTIVAAGGNDTVIGGQGNDNLQGGAGNDHITGGPGNDTIDGGPDNDNCQGGPGTDNVTNCKP